MSLTISVGTISGLLLLGVVKFCGGSSVGAAWIGTAAAVLGWAAAVSTVAWLYGTAMEIFMAHYSGVFVNGAKIDLRRFRRLTVPLAMHAVAILACVPAIRQDAKWLVGTCLVSLAGIIWQLRISKTLV